MEHPVGMFQEKLALPPGVILRPHHLHRRYQEHRLGISLSEGCEHLELFKEDRRDIQRRNFQIDSKIFRIFFTRSKNPVESPGKGEDLAVVYVEAYSHFMAPEIIQVLGNL